MGDLMQLSARVQNIVGGGDDGWGLYYEARRLAQDGQPVTMLSIGDHDIKTDPRILTTMQESAERGNLGYTDVAGAHRLREAIAARTSALNSLPAEAANVTITSGGQAAIFSAMTSVLDPGQSCILLAPYYTSFQTTVRGVSARPIIVSTRSEDGFQPDAAAIEAALEPDTRAILINTPNNPSGAVYSRERLEALSDLCLRRDLWLISDELYDSQVYEGDHLSPRDLPGMAERSIVIGSMSKAYAMTGCRIGWAVAPADVITHMVDLAGATTYGLPGFLQDAATFALTQLPSLETEIAERYRRRRDLALRALGNSPALRVVPPQGGMYIMLDVRGTGLDGIEFTRRLLHEELIGVMPGESFGHAAAGHIRIALTVEDQKLADAMCRIGALATRVSQG